MNQDREDSQGTGVLPLDHARAPSSADLRHGARIVRVASPEGLDVGTAEENGLVLEDPYVSARHCRIEHDGWGWRIRDLGSTNGTSVNGLRVREAMLPREARILVGRTELRFTAGPGPANTSLAPGMVAASAAMREVLDRVRLWADAREPVLVLGDSGTGKEGIARAFHDASSRSSGPYVALNCGAFAAGLVESELFGYVKGAFTGAQVDRGGAFEAAQGGTLFLDEIGELPLDLQPKLLRVLENRTVRRVGSTREVPVDVRVVAATHRNLEGLVIEGRFRADLYHRLFVLPIRLPPLAERPEDLEVLAERFVERASHGTKRLAPEAMVALLAHPWPGNVRELRNVLIRASLSTEGAVIRASDLEFSEGPLRTPRVAMTRIRPEEEERRRLEEAIRAEGGNRAAAARRLGISKSTFYDRARRLGLAPKV